MLHALRDKGDTVLVVEHHPDVITAADQVVDIGPGAGTHGGTVVFHGTPAGMRAGDTPTARARGVALNRNPRTPRGHLSVRGATTHHLAGIDVDFPLGVLTCVTGVGDHVIDLGPDAGPYGGRLTFTGPPSGLATTGTHTGRALARRLGRRPQVR